ncbi:unnamed protein product [Amoebophrya sp. A120]|nr:unnamed protein product [Amoebophrya sp. A120]|eukprot:GSA120T00014855001.1
MTDAMASKAIPKAAGYGGSTTSSSNPYANRADKAFEENLQKEEKHRAAQGRKRERQNGGSSDQVIDVETQVKVPADIADKVLKKPRRECPYLSTVNRNVLDFDFERVCSVTMRDQNIYACLVCGKFFQGRGKGTTAYLHSLECEHYVFINLDNAKIYCLPDDYEVIDASLNDVKFNLRPKYQLHDILEIDKGNHAKSLDGTDFIPGCVGLNNIKQSDYLNCFLQLLCVVIPVRNWLLLHEYEDKNTLALNGIHKKPEDPVVRTLSELMKKIYNPQNFKGIVSPHEVFQAIGKVSHKKFYGEQHDPVALFSYLMSYLARKKMPILTKTFEGEVGVKSSPVSLTNWTDSSHKSVVLQLDVPPAPLFKENVNFIPQVPLFTLLEKYNGETIHESIAKTGEDRQQRKFTLRRLPPYVLFQIKRFKHNGYFTEKNPTIINFPLRDLDLKTYLHPGAAAANPITNYHLVASIIHSGKPKGGEYKIHCLHKELNTWHEVQDLRVSEVLPQAVALAILGEENLRGHDNIIVMLGHKSSRLLCRLRLFRACTQRKGLSVDLCMTSTNVFGPAGYL